MNKHLSGVQNGIKIVSYFHQLMKSQVVEGVSVLAPFPGFYWATASAESSHWNAPWNLGHKYDDIPF